MVEFRFHRKLRKLDVSSHVDQCDQSFLKADRALKYPGR